MVDHAQTQEAARPQAATALDPALGQLKTAPRTLGNALHQPGCERRQRGMQARRQQGVGAGALDLGNDLERLHTG